MAAKKSKPIQVLWVVVAVAVVGFGLVRLRPRREPVPQPPVAQAKTAGPVAPAADGKNATRNFNPTQICDDALQPYQVIDHSSDTDLDSFDIPLQEGCFGKLVLLPKSWYRWRNQNATNDQSGWVSFLVENQSAEPPGDMNREVPLTANRSFRVQGKGTVRILKVQ